MSSTTQEHNPVSPQHIGVVVPVYGGRSCLRHLHEQLIAVPMLVMSGVTVGAGL
ncbi:MAG TPA: hypothetical protein VK680_10835 [Solirubrobacteraceae bacterium]|jgi:hypothetical protein|nr:hypothetical protein [Solirubrobacteraceae bacterium]